MGPSPSSTRRRPTSAPSGAPAAPRTAAAANPKEKKQFAREMRYQVFRLDNSLRLTDKTLLLKLLKNNPALAGISGKPLVTQFFTEYSKIGRTPETIVEANKKTSERRETLLHDIRQVVYRAKRKKMDAQKVAAGQNAQQDAESTAFQEKMKRQLSDGEISRIETGLQTPFDTQEGKVDIGEIQGYYKKVIMGQKAFGQKVQGLQGSYKTAHKAYMKNVKSNKSTTIFGWGASKLGGSSSVNKKAKKALKKARGYFKTNFAQSQRLKNHIKNRSAEVKKGIISFRTFIRKKLKGKIIGVEWKKMQQMTQEKLKAFLKKKKKELETKFRNARTQGRQINKAKRGQVRLSASMRTRLQTIHTSSSTLDNRIGKVDKRIGQMLKIYGSDHPKVKHLRENVLAPLLQGKDQLIAGRDRTGASLTAIQRRNQRLDIMRSDIYLGQTQAAEAILATEAQITRTTKKIGVLNTSRLKEHKLISQMEMGYASIDEFETNTSKTLDNITTNNEKIFKEMGSINTALGKMKVTGPRFSESLYNTPVLGKWGIGGLLKTVDRIPGFFAALGDKALSLFTGNKTDFWKTTDRWSITGQWGFVAAKIDKFLANGGFGDTWYGSVGNFFAGVVSGAVSLVHGVLFAITNMHLVLESLGTMIREPSKFWGLLKAIIHYDDFANGRKAAGAGKVVFEVIFAIVTCGVGTAAAGGAKTAGVLAKGASLGAKVAWAGKYIAGFAKGFTVEMVRQNVQAIANLGRALARFGRSFFKGAGGIGVWARLKTFVPFMRSEAKFKLAQTRMADEAAGVGKILDKHAKDFIASNVDDAGGMTKMLDELKDINKLTPDQLDDLGRRLQVHVYKNPTRNATRNGMEQLLKSVQRYRKAKLKALKFGGRGAIDDFAAEFQKVTQGVGGKVDEATDLARSVGKKADDFGNDLDKLLPEYVDNITAARGRTIKKADDLNGAAKGVATTARKYADDAKKLADDLDGLVTKNASAEKILRTSRRLDEALQKARHAETQLDSIISKVDELKAANKASGDGFLRPREVRPPSRTAVRDAKYNFKTQPRNSLRETIETANSSIKKFKPEMPKLNLPGADDLARNIDGIELLPRKVLYERYGINAAMNNKILKELGGDMDLFQQFRRLLRGRPKTLAQRRALAKRVDDMRNSLNSGSQPALTRLLRNRASYLGHWQASVRIARNFMKGSFGIKLKPGESLFGKLGKAKNWKKFGVGATKLSAKVLTAPVYIPWRMFKRWANFRRKWLKGMKKGPNGKLVIDGPTTKLISKQFGIPKAQVRPFMTKMLEGAGQVDAILAMSKNVSRHLKRGDLRSALETYQAMRYLGRSMPDIGAATITLMDSSFFNYLHRVMPTTEIFLARMSDVARSTIIDEVPAYVPPVTSRMDAIQKERQEKLRKLRQGSASYRNRANDDGTARGRARRR